MPQLAEIERCLGDDRILRRVCLPEWVANEFQSCDREQRRRQAIWGMLLGLFFYSAMLAVDRILVPDIYALNVAARLGVGIPVGLGVTWLLMRQSLPPVVHQWGVGLFGYTCVLTMSYVMAHSRDPAALVYFSASFIVLCFTINLVGLTTVSAAVLCLATTVTVPLFIAGSAFASPGTVVTYGVIGLMVTIACVFANWCLANQDRRNFLIRRTDQLRLQQVSRQRELLERLAAIDPLTGLANRRGFDAMMNGDLSRSSAGTPVAVAMIDIDCFKLFNDTYGHACGDEALKAVAQTLAENSEGYARIGRMGGEEFALSIVGCDHADLQGFGDRLRRAVELQAIPHARNTASSFVTVSIGLAGTWMGANDDHAALFRIADEALYEAKASGRNLARVRLKASRNSPRSVGPVTGPCLVDAAGITRIRR